MFRQYRNFEGPENVGSFRTYAHCDRPEWADDEDCPIDTGELDDCTEDCPYYAEEIVRTSW